VGGAIPRRDAGWAALSEVASFLLMLAGVAALVAALLAGIQVGIVALYVAEGMPALFCGAWRKARKWWEA
jgi:hypothetical protein